ncbi:amidohydrolase [Podospora australis]|uniref:Amidohydrolase n=1 Tax=Podospora australis TaxID=1536484 RepID=A0AAN6X5C1_9PEZI|nr:amidohydrolase [Podospora australis]
MIYLPSYRNTKPHPHICGHSSPGLHHFNFTTSPESTQRPAKMADSRSPVVDVHTHMYPPEYITLLTTRTAIPLVRTFPGSPDPRLILLEAELPLLEKALSGECSGQLPGRPLTKDYASLPQKLHFMSAHGIDISVLSLANPWLDFLPPSTAVSFAQTIASSFETSCAANPGKLYFFAALPLTAPIPDLLAFIPTLLNLSHCRGVILGTTGLGQGLDDPDLLPVFEALAAASLPIFLHPHYGLPNSVFGPAAARGEYGHVLPLALGFPMETTIAVTRMFLSGVFDKVPSLRMILAHSGGTLPFLAGRIESCILHDAHLAAEYQKSGKDKKRRTIWEVLEEQVYLDAVVYSAVGLKAAIMASGEWGSERLMFGTDHPFFPPVGDDEGNEKWESVGLNRTAVAMVLGEGSKVGQMVMGGNAVRVLRLDEE